MGIAYRYPCGGGTWAAVWAAVAAVGSVASAAVAAWAAHQSRASARDANAASQTLAGIEADRRHAELTPRFRVTCEPGNPGTTNRTLRVMLLGPPGLEHVDQLTVTVRDDHFRRGDIQLLAGGPSREEIKKQIWGPYRFTPHTGPDEARADGTGRTTVYDHPLPIGEELPYQLEQTWPPPWASAHTMQPDWIRERGTLIRLALIASHGDHGQWTVPCEIDIGTGDKTVTVYVPGEQPTVGQ